MEVQGNGNFNALIENMSNPCFSQYYISRCITQIKNIISTVLLELTSTMQSKKMNISF